MSQGSNSQISQKQARGRFFQRPAWRWVLVLGSLSVVLASLWLVHRIAERMKEQEEKYVQTWADITRATQTAMEAEEGDFTAILDLQIQAQERNTTIPVAFTTADSIVIQAINAQELTKKKPLPKDWLEGAKRIEIELSGGKKQYIFYKNSTLLYALEWLPYIQLALLLVFGLLAYFTWAAARVAEQERVWVGMAKETAHQLGTPITSLVGWVENMRAMYETDDYILMVADEINKDIRLLSTVAERFSKMGAAPELARTNVLDNLHHYHEYIRQRASKKIQFHFPDPANDAPVYAQINSLLFDWVIENLLKNALDAMETGTGSITVRAWEEPHWVHIDISDTGKGMPQQNFKKVFLPGFSTKKRGWGLGLSLCKRIIQEYHKGKIFVHASEVGKGTTFRILLPV